MKFLAPAEQLSVRIPLIKLCVMFPFYSNGQEITKNYMLDTIYKAAINGADLKNFKERQKFCHSRGFVCSCELCQEEEIDNDDETYQKFQNLKEEVEKIKRNFLSNNPCESKFDHFEKIIACRKQMYNLAKNKKAPVLHVLGYILDVAFKDGYGGNTVQN